MENGEWRMENVDIFDIYGRKQKAESRRQKAESRRQKAEFLKAPLVAERDEKKSPSNFEGVILRSRIGVVYIRYCSLIRRKANNF